MTIAELETENRRLHDLILQITKEILQLIRENRTQPKPERIL